MSKADCSTADIQWIVSDQRVGYLEAVQWMESRAAAVALGTAPECIWLLEHPPLYTAGTSANPKDLLDQRLPVFAAGRGGQYTYHGPGQRVVYLVIDLNKRGRDVRQFVWSIERWMIAALAHFGVSAYRAPGRVGIWVDDPAKGEAKLGAIGIRVRKWVSLHGFAINIAPDLTHFDGIVPCGIRQYGVTSLSNLGINISMSIFDAALMAEFASFLAQPRQPQSA